MHLETNLGIAARPAETAFEASLDLSSGGRTRTWSRRAVRKHPIQQTAKLRNRGATNDNQHCRCDTVLVPDKRRFEVGNQGQVAAGDLPRRHVRIIDRRPHNSRDVGQRFGYHDELAPVAESF